MKFTEKSHQATYTRRVQVEDGPVHGQAYSTTGRRFRVTHVEILYSLNAEGEWSVKNDFAIKVSGVVLKKDGSDSANHHTRSPERFNWSDKKPIPEWEWLTILVDALRPEGTPELPIFLRELTL
jgi:hypothetical protein